jgi:hypothetical protein
MRITQMREYFSRGHDSPSVLRAPREVGARGSVNQRRVHRVRSNDLLGRFEVNAEMLGVSPGLVRCADLAPGKSKCRRSWDGR